MKFIKPAKKKLIIFFSACAAILSIAYIRLISVFPNQLTLFENQEYIYKFKSPLLVNLVNFKSDNNDILIFDSEDIKINNDDYKDTKTK